MNCDQSHLILSRERDEPLSGQQQQALAEHLANCPLCREFKHTLHRLANTLQAELDTITTPDADQEWRLLRSRLHQDASPEKSRWLVPLLWVSAPLAAAAAVAFIFLTPPRTTVSPQMPVLVASLPTQVDAGIQVEYIRTGDDAATTMVYVDKQSGWLVVWADVPSGHAKI